jgi:hypothetical protein
VERAPREEPIEESFELRFGLLMGEALRLLAALGDAPAFPINVAGVERLLAAVVPKEPDLPSRFAVEHPGALPRYTGRHLFWVCPRGDGRLRVRSEDYALQASAVTLAPDGRFSDFERQRGFGVPEAELTEQARADRELVERRAREAEEEYVAGQRRRETERGRFRVDGLRGVTAAPWQDPAGLVIAWVAFYEPGFIVSHLLPREIGEWHPPLRIVDDLGNEYDEIGSGRTSINKPLYRAGREFGPGVAAGARRLMVHSDWGVVDVEVAP